MYSSGTPPQKRARRDSSSGANGSASSSLPPLSLSILGVEPLDEFIKEIADFIHHMIVTRPSIPGNVEVEAKVGVLRDNDRGARLMLPVLVETILAPDSVDCRFESNMTAHQHKHYNTLLNNLKTSTATGAAMDYHHLYYVDTFYMGDNKEKIRVTRDEKTGNVVECIRKIKLGTLNIYSPKRAADWRVTVNLEVPEPHPVGSSTMTRRKDRMNYTHEEFAIDLTQVTMSSATGPPEILHELELEIARSELLLSAAAQRGDPNVPESERFAFDELIRAFVNNARILVRNSMVTDGWH
ncbi:mRNA capping enzyme [Armillaria novae-zelandiae]|uniref:mRNA-capping enzyme subunit beta n=1 Tax=Armillaria novae-zelandiae TaxID=153914 RepID=A0AA39UHG4_9AGAR|nr:mRNA capping enzyme [Armillaria novae-zelandiae]